jgi:hypothetical protein
MKALGYILFLVGVMLASVFAAPSKPLWGYFSVFALTAAIGALMIRFAKRAGPSPVRDGKVSDLSVSEEALYRSIRDIGERAGVLAAKAGGDMLTADEMKKEIEETLEGMKFFIEGRQFLQERHGIRAISEIYSSFAGGERLLSRAWSALVDGYVHETKSCLRIAGSRLSGTVELYEGLIIEDKD